MEVPRGLGLYGPETLQTGWDAESTGDPSVDRRGLEGQEAAV